MPIVHSQNLANSFIYRMDVKVLGFTLPNLPFVPKPGPKQGLPSGCGRSQKLSILENVEASTCRVFHVLQHAPLRRQGGVAFQWDTFSIPAGEPGFNSCQHVSLTPMRAGDKELVLLG